MQFTKPWNDTKVENSKAFTAEYSNQKSNVNAPTTSSYYDFFSNHAVFAL